MRPRDAGRRVLAEEVTGVAGPMVRPALVVAFPVICEALDTGKPITAGVEIGNQRRYRLGESLGYRDPMAAGNVDRYQAAPSGLGGRRLVGRGVGVGPKRSGFRSPLVR